MNDWKPNEKVTQWRKLAEYWGRQTECPAALILAVIEQESGGDKDAVRYEPEYEKRYKARCEEIAAEAGITVAQAASSYGLMQLMLPLAWGYMGNEQKKELITNKSQIAFERFGRTDRSSHRRSLFPSCNN